MKRTFTNLSVDTLLLMVLLAEAFTGILLHRFPAGLAGATVLGLTRYSWGAIHWAASVLFVVLIIAHLVLHRGWMAATMRKYFRMESLVLLVVMAVISAFILLAPFYLTRDLRDRRGVGETPAEVTPAQSNVQEDRLAVTNTP